jgi:2Fe-2S ferredoxin
MPKLNVIMRSGERRTLEGTSGHSVKETLMKGGVSEINAITNCGGCCSCGTCHIYIEPADMARVPPMEGQEDDLLYIRDDRRENSRLACQVRLSDALDGLTVTVAPEW